MATGFRMAAAPITWGICEVPGWGHQMAPQRVLAEMRELGLVATEAGPDGFLPHDPDEARALLHDHGLQLAAAFVPAVLHDPDRWTEEREAVTRRFTALTRLGTDVVVVAAATGDHGYEEGRILNDAGWDRLADSLDELAEIADRNGMRLTVHPHYGTVIETPEQIERFLEVSDAAMCLDTGHVLVGGGNPLEVARLAPERIGHVHLKDVDAATAARVRAGNVTYHDATAAGLYRVLGAGDVDVAPIVATLDLAGFTGWLVLEHDIVLTGEPPAEGGPKRDAEASLRHLERVVAALEAVEPHR